jgi:ribonuclease P protein component
MNSFYLRVKPADKAKVIISVSKKVSKKAVERNLIKRRIRPIIREFLPKLKPGEYFIIANQGAEKVKGKELRKELEVLVVSCWL